MLDIGEIFSTIYDINNLIISVRYKSIFYDGLDSNNFQIKFMDFHKILNIQIYFHRFHKRLAFKFCPKSNSS